MSYPQEPPSSEGQSWADKAMGWAEPHYDKIIAYMKASGSPDAAVCVAALLAFVACLVAGYPYLGFAFCTLVVAAYAILTGARLFLDVDTRKRSFDHLVEDQLDAIKQRRSER